ncbi:MAG: class I SAM-dependent methyltransferase [Nocardioidaceae bacterium]
MRYRPDELFRSTAPYYARYRAGYPEEFFTYLRERFHLDGSQRVLDLGCGTGQIAVPIARDTRKVIAVDPEPAMLEEGRKVAAKQGITNVDWRVGDSYHLRNLGIGPVDLAAMGASFHWMDRDDILGAYSEGVNPSR